MNKPRILIVDDEAPARARLKDLIADIQDTCPCDLLGEASDGQTALDLLTEHKPEILLLDVQMPGMTGIELAQHIANSSVIETPAIIFVTAYDEYALQAFEVHAMDYLLKPVRAQRLVEAIQRIQQFKAQPITTPAAKSPSERLLETVQAMPKIRQNFSVLEKNRVLLIPVRDVLFLKAEQKYVTIQTRTRAYLTEESLVSIEAEMSSVFVRVHRNALVARDAIVGVERATHSVDSEGESERATESWQVIVRDSNERLPISRRQWATVKTLVR